MAGEILAGGKVTLHCGDCLDVLPTIEENSIDSFCGDPPYHLTSIVDRFGAEDAAPAREGKTGVYARSSRGFMGKQWDGGDVAFRPETWREVFRVLKPGGHLIAFSGTRTYHRMACAIEDAGFEIRDQIGWAYGTGFPKSHDVSKAIDDHLFHVWLDADAARLAAFTAEIAKAKTINNPDTKRRAVRGIIAKWKKLGGFARKVVATREAHDIRGGNLMEASQGIGKGKTEYAYTKAATPEAAEWEGWGTAIKPSWEPCVLARKPLDGTVAENVLTHRTGGIHIDVCRIGRVPPRAPGDEGIEGRERQNGFKLCAGRAHELGGYPANIITDGSAEVLEQFPETSSGGAPTAGNQNGGVYGEFNNRSLTHQGASSSSAARFFYTPKADADDRLGSKHPTVKPIDLMQYLIRLVTPKGGVVLDCFAGTGTTGEAAYREGFRAVLIEREPEYQADIRRRMSLVLGGPDERHVAAIKAAGKATEDAGPLFAFEGK